jgi:hypothetical protein
MKTLIESIADFKATQIDWETEFQEITIFGEGVEGTAGGFTIEFDIEGSRSFKRTNATHYEPSEWDMEDAEIEINNLRVFDVDFEDYEMTQQEEDLLTTEILSYYED